MGVFKSLIIGTLLLFSTSSLAVSPAVHIQESPQNTYVTTEAALRAEVFFNLKSMKQMIRSSRVGEWGFEKELRNDDPELSQRKK